MSEILVHAFGDNTCELHITKHASSDSEQKHLYVVAAFIHEGTDGKRALADSLGIEVRTTDRDRRGAIRQMVTYLEHRLGSFDARARAIDLRRRECLPPLPDTRPH
jgi:hypothetical protein